MTTYYVRKSGNDGNGGESAGDAWLTIDNAANNVAAGDTVYVGSGIYREMVTMDTSGSSGSQISFIMDITGAYTGDPGPVIISAFDTETGSAARAYALNMNEKEFITWQYAIFLGGTVATVGYNGAGHVAYEGCQILDCYINRGDATADDAIYLNINHGATPATTGLIIDRCVINGMVNIHHDNNAVADVNLKWLIQNCVLITMNAQDCIKVYGDSSNTFGIGGIDVINCTLHGANYSTSWRFIRDSVNPCRVLNCWIEHATYGVQDSFPASDANAIYEDYNRGSSVTVGVSGASIQSGGNSDWACACVPFGGQADMMFYRKLGWSPWKPWEPLTLLDGTYNPPTVGAGSATYAPAYDLLYNPRPLGRNTDDIGAIEGNPRGSRETTTVRSGANSLGFHRGAGYTDKLVQVDAVATKVSVYAQYDGNYTGSLPILRVLNIPGVADQDDEMTGGSGAWEALSCAFTPTEAGYVRVRMESRDTSADGECFFDDLRVK